MERYRVMGDFAWGCLSVCVFSALCLLTHSSLLFSAPGYILIGVSLLMYSCARVYVYVCSSTRASLIVCGLVLSCLVFRPINLGMLACMAFLGGRVLHMSLVVCDVGIEIMW